MNLLMSNSDSLGLDQFHTLPSEPSTAMRAQFVDRKQARSVIMGRPFIHALMFSSQRKGLQ